MRGSTFDYLILGQGLAGSLLGWQLLNRGQRVLVLDDGLRSSASNVAAGLINPLAGMRYNRSAHTAAWLESAHRTYLSFGRTAQREYLHSIEMLRLFRSPQQQRFYERQQADSDSGAYFGRRIDSNELARIGETAVQAPHGAFTQQATGYLDIPALLSQLRQQLEQRQAYLNLPVDYAQIEVSQEGVRVADLRAKALIFCEGFRMLENPWFGALPLQPDKGEIFTLKSNDRLCKRIVNGAHWLIPLVDGNYRFGATHAHKQLHSRPTETAHAALNAGLRALLKPTIDWQVTHQQAGVRPATSDRQPFVGGHPSLPQLFLFNGFGARGALTIPWFAEQMSAYLLDHKPLPEAADLRRFASRL